MKALKSKAMKIGSVLESIVILFSGPDRRPLLKRYASVTLTLYRDLVVVKFYLEVWIWSSLFICFCFLCYDDILFREQSLIV